MKTILIAVAAMLLISSHSVLADRPDPEVPNPPLQVQEYNVDGDGFIAVHEQGTAKVEVQGTADVNVTGGSIDAEITGGEVEVTNSVEVNGSVGVNNFPGEQGVYVNAGRLSSVTEVFAQTYSVVHDETAVSEFGRTIDATTITVSTHESANVDSYPEFIVRFYSPLVPDVQPVQPVLVVNDTGAEIRFETMSFTYPIPLGGLTVECLNEEYNCYLDISVFGFLGE